MGHHDDDNFDDEDTEPGVTDREAPDPSDTDDGDGEDADTDPCPYCHKPVYAGTEICPHCRNFISFEDAPRRRPWWIWVGVLLCVLAALTFIF